MLWVKELYKYERIERYEMEYNKVKFYYNLDGEVQKRNKNLITWRQEARSSFLEFWDVFESKEHFIINHFSLLQSLHFPQPLILQLIPFFFQVPNVVEYLSRLPFFPVPETQRMVVEPGLKMSFCKTHILFNGNIVRNYYKFYRGIMDSIIQFPFNGH